jgi:hypothetical protein
MPQFAVLHIQKNGGQTIALGHHIDRTHIPENADPEKAKLNQVIIDHGQNLDRAIEARIKQGYTGKTAIRKDAVKSISLILTGSHERMKEIEKENNLPAWIAVNRKWLENKYGKQNIVSLALHRDESTPHLHAVIVPLTADGRLTAKEMVGNKKELINLQDEYAQVMSNFNLERGIKGSRATHQDVKEYYKTMNQGSNDIPTPELDTPPLMNREKWAGSKQTEINQAFQELKTENKNLKAALILKNKATGKLQEENKMLREEQKKYLEVNSKLGKEVLRWRTGERTLDKFKLELARTDRFLDDKGYILSKPSFEQQNENKAKIEPVVKQKPKGYRL